MTEIAYERGLRRLRVSGDCEPQDAAAVRSAVECFGGGAPRLTVDLTAVPAMAPDVAAVLVDAARALEEQGCRITILRKWDTDTDHLLRELHH